jgi:hypothetical protein
MTTTLPVVGRDGSAEGRSTVSANLGAKIMGRDGEIERLSAINADMLVALKKAQAVLAMMVSPAAIQQSTTMHAYAQAVEAEGAARAAIAKADAMRAHHSGEAP